MIKFLTPKERVIHMKHQVGLEDVAEVLTLLKENPKLTTKQIKICPSVNVKSNVLLKSCKRCKKSKELDLTERDTGKCTTDYGLFGVRLSGFKHDENGTAAQVDDSSTFATAPFASSGSSTHTSWDVHKIELTMDSICIRVVLRINVSKSLSLIINGNSVQPRINASAFCFVNKRSAISRIFCLSSGTTIPSSSFGKMML